ncbi:MAG: glycoside-pentoside-hexuronide (GPH):cation symporter [Lachnospiraceae bacterium]|nr:glycoside-pentoside-hexuronide (GPH):cation symporter [Lachnospiraceae bacterium]
MKKDMSSNAKLSFLERFGYGVGDYAANLVYSAISAFLLVYYTNVIGASAAAASIIAVSKIFDGISDLVMGYIVDHTNTKYGKARPWIARLCVPLAVCTVLMFSVPASFAGKTQIAYMFLTYNLVSTIFYTGVNVPYATLQGLITTNQYERGLLGNFRNLLSTAGTMTINTVVLKMTGYFGGGDAYTQKGWTITIAILMIVFISLNMFTFFTCSERVTGQESGTKKESVSFAKGLKALVKNKYWILMSLNLFSMFFMMSSFFGSVLFFTKYNMGNEDQYSMVANLLSGAQIVTLFITPFIMKKVSKRNLNMTGMAIVAVGLVLSGLSTNYTFICITSIIKGVVLGCAGATMFGCLQDAITYGEWNAGYSVAGMGNAASSFCFKIGSGLGTAALGWVLAAGGFDAAKAVQDTAALTAITTAFAWIPAVTSALCVVCMLFFDLDRHYGRAVADLAAGKYRQ